MQMLLEQLEERLENERRVSRLKTETIARLITILNDLVDTNLIVNYNVCVAIKTTIKELEPYIEEMKRG